MKNTILDHDGKVWREESATPSFNRFIRKRELRWIIPLSDTTIYEMECRGEFPRRFALTPRCVAWNLNEVQAWMEERLRNVRNEVTNQALGPDVRLRRTRPVKRRG